MQTNFSRHSFALLALFAIESIIFYRIVAEQIAPYYPPYYDQASYYFGVYELVERVRSLGLIELLREFAPPKNAFGATFLPQGAVLALIGGNTRTSILSLNLVYFILLQAILFETIRHKTNDMMLAWFGIALLVPMKTIFSVYGGIYDFRVDFTASCSYGIWICSVLWSDVFRRRDKSVAVAFVSVMLVSLRFITAVYVAAILVGLFISFVVGAWRHATAFQRGVATLRARNILISGALTAIVVVPLLIAAKDIIYFYYVIGQVLNEEKYIRARELGLQTVFDHIKYYPRSVFQQHLGRFPIVLWGALEILLAARLWLNRSSVQNIVSAFRFYRLDLLFLALATILPMGILTVNVAKSPVVGGIIVVPILMAGVLFCAILWSPCVIKYIQKVPTGRKVGENGILSNSLVTMVCVGLLALGLFSFHRNAVARQHYLQRDDLEHVTIINEAIARHVVENSIVNPKISIDRVVDYLNLPTVRLATYERFGKIIYYVGSFGGIFATPRDLALQQIADSDIIVLTDPLRGREAPYPINSKIPEYWDELLHWTEQNRTLLLSLDILGVSYRTYVKNYSK